MTYIYFKTYLVEKYINRKIIRTEKYINGKTCYFTNIGWRLSPRFGQEVSGGADSIPRNIAGHQTVFG